MQISSGEIVYAVFRVFLGLGENYHAASIHRLRGDQVRRRFSPFIF